MDGWVEKLSKPIMLLLFVLLLFDGGEIDRHVAFQFGSGSPPNLELHNSVDICSDVSQHLLLLFRLAVAVDSK